MKVFIDSFEALASEDLALKYDGDGGTVCAISSGGKNGKCLNVIGMGISLRKTFAADSDQWVVGFDMGLPSAITREEPFFMLTDAGDPIIGLGVTSEKLSVHRWTGSAWTSLWQDTISEATGNWYYIEWKTLVNASTGTYEIHLTDRSQTPRVIQIRVGATGSNTGSASPDGFEIQWNSESESVLIDNLYVLDGDTDGPTDFQGPLRVACVVSDGNGSLVEWDSSTGDANWQNIHELPADFDISYNGALEAGSDYYGVPFTLEDGETIGGVQMFSVVCAGTPDLILKSHLKSGETDIASAEIPLPDMAYVCHLDQFDKNPNGDIDWTGEALAAVEIGVSAE